MEHSLVMTFLKTKKKTAEDAVRETLKSLLTNKAEVLHDCEALLLLT